jgi:hypothetical protein
LLDRQNLAVTGKPAFRHEIERDGDDLTDERFHRLPLPWLWLIRAMFLRGFFGMLQFADARLPELAYSDPALFSSAVFSSTVLGRNNRTALYRNDSRRQVHQSLKSTAPARATATAALRGQKRCPGCGHAGSPTGR